MNVKRKTSRALLCLMAAFAFMPRAAFADTAEPPAAASPRYLFQLSAADAEEAISGALSQKGAGDKVAASLNGIRSGALFSYDKPLTVEIHGLRFDKPSRHWSANLMFVAGDETVSALPVSGNYDEMVEAPVLKREVHSGDIIGKEDIEIRDFSLAHTRSDTVTDLSALIGKTPIRTISAERPIREHEIASPALVRKNGIVQMRYTSPDMEISATGQAMTDGAKGDVIEVRNTASRRIVRAVVEDADTVSIIAPGQNLSESKNSQLTGDAHATN